MEGMEKLFLGKGECYEGKEDIFFWKKINFIEGTKMLTCFFVVVFKICM